MLRCSTFFLGLCSALVLTTFASSSNLLKENKITDHSDGHSPALNPFRTEWNLDLTHSVCTKKEFCSSLPQHFAKCIEHDLPNALTVKLEHRAGSVERQMPPTLRALVSRCQMQLLPDQTNHRVRRNAKQPTVGMRVDLITDDGIETDCETEAVITFTTGTVANDDSLKTMRQAIAKQYWLPDELLQLKKDGGDHKLVFSACKGAIADAFDKMVQDCKVGTSCPVTNVESISQKQKTDVVPGNNHDYVINLPGPIDSSRVAVLKSTIEDVFDFKSMASACIGNIRVVGQKVTMPCPQSDVLDRLFQKLKSKVVAPDFKLTDGKKIQGPGAGRGGSGDDEEDGGSNAGVYIGVMFGLLVVIGLIGLAVYFKRRNTNEQSITNPEKSRHRTEEPEDEPVCTEETQESEPITEQTAKTNVVEGDPVDEEAGGGEAPKSGVEQQKTNPLSEGQKKQSEKREPPSLNPPPPSEG